jgi:glucose/arabinose dehydrogenase
MPEPAEQQVYQTVGRILTVVRRDRASHVLFAGMPKRRFQHLAALLVLAAVLTACIPNPPPGRGRNPDLTVSTVVSGFDHVWDIAFTPDAQWMIFDERLGKIWAMPFPSGAPRLLGNVPDVVVHGEGGLLGLAVDPNFGSNQFVYACYDTAADVRVVRFTTDLAPNSLTLSAPIVTGMPVNTATGRHSGCRPRFRPGTNPAQLFVGTGDSGTDGSIAQNLHSLGGKVLCVTNDGNPCSNNPGVVNPSFDIDDRIWSWGHRNVQGIAFSPSGGGYTVEHGTDRDDEVNVLFQGNFGWNPVPGYDESQPMTGPGGIGAAWSSGVPSIAPSGATILTGGQWQGWQGAAAIAVLKAQELLVVFFDDFLGFSSIGTTFNMRGAGRLRSAVEGPDGNLYVSTDNGGGADVILRAVPS